MTYEQFWITVTEVFEKIGLDVNIMAKSYTNVMTSFFGITITILLGAILTSQQIDEPLHRAIIAIAIGIPLQALLAWQCRSLQSAARANDFKWLLISFWAFILALGNITFILGCIFSHLKILPIYLLGFIIAALFLLCLVVIDLVIHRKKV